MIDLEPLNRFSAHVGTDLLLTQGAGGNLSQKSDDAKELWVKASGAWLADAMDKPIYLGLHLPTLLRLFEMDNTDDLSSTFLVPTTLRPSIEALLHAVMPQKIVVHLHAIAAMYWSVLTEGYQQLRAHAPQLAIGWIPYTKPGAPLAKAVYAVQKAHPNLHTFILANHGLLFGAASMVDAKEMLADLMTRLMPEKRKVMLHMPEEPPTLSGTADAWFWADNVEVHALAQDPVAFDILQRGILYPDQVVFLGVRPPIVENHMTEVSLALKWAVVPGVGVLIHRDLSKNAYALLEAHAQLLLRLQATQTLNFLTQEDIAALINWDAEKYRQQIAI